jgi:ferric-dicitrate binding protein FerR (iron transport regulator)
MHSIDDTPADPAVISRRAALFLPASLVLPGAEAMAASAAGEVTDVLGRAQARRRREVLDLARQAPIFVNDLIETGAEARVEIALGATRLRLGAGATLKIDRFLPARGGIVTLGEGALLFDRAEDAGRTDLRVRSAYAVVAVRGTRFFAGPSNGAFGVFVERGAVDVRAGGRRVRLEAGLGCDVATPGARPTPAKAWGAARIAAALAAVD